MRRRKPAIVENFPCLSTKGKGQAWFPGGAPSPGWKIVKSGGGEGSFWVLVESTDRLVVEYSVDGHECTQDVMLSWCPRPLGGAQLAFQCPECGRGRRKLYVVDRVLGCMACRGLYYRSQGESIATRRARLAINLAARLGVQARPYGDPDPPCPKSMAPLVYARLLYRYRAAQAEALEALAADMGANTARREAREDLFIDDNNVQP